MSNIQSLMDDIDNVLDDDILGYDRRLELCIL